MANLTVHSNLPRTLPGCHGNEIWGKIGYNAAFARNIREIFASIGGFWGLGYRMLPMKLCLDPFWLPGQHNLGQNKL